MNDQEHPRKGTAVSKKYQTEESRTSGPAVPEQVSVAIEEVTADVREGLGRFIPLRCGVWLMVAGWRGARCWGG
ncbi:MAG: hypothetical protein ACRDRN_05260 [Sciscionella sp.]